MLPRVSAGCEHCYAEVVAARFSGPGLAYEGLARRRSNGQPQWTGVVRFVESKLLEPLKWKRPARVFVNSMSDLFHEKVSDETLDKIFAVMALTPRHTYQVLTKRPRRMRDYMRTPNRKRIIAEQVMGISDWLAVAARSYHARITTAHFSACFAGEGPFPNIHLGTSIEDQPSADERVPLLRETPAATRFLSAEPLLAPIGLRWLLFPNPGIHWVITGGESGSGARKCSTSWIGSIVDQCEGAGVPVFVKQLGARPFDEDNQHFVQLSSRKGGDPSEWPAELRVREFPVQS
jgi:protein gp37